MRLKSLFLILLKYVGILLTVAAALALLILLIAGNITPEIVPQLSLLTLCAPVIYIINIVLMLIWIIAWKKWALISLSALLIGLNASGKLLQPDFKKKYNNSLKGIAKLKVMTYNVEGFTHNCRGMASQLDSITDLFIANDADIICIQEFRTLPDAPQSYIDSVMSAWPYKKIYSFDKRIYAPSIAIYSKKKILKSEYVRLNEKLGHGAVWCDVLIEKGDTLRILSTHLQSTQISNTDITFLTEEPFSEIGDTSIKKRRMETIATKLQKNSAIRATHADSLRVILDQCPHRILLCGDFNDTPMSYTYRTLKGDLDDAFTQAGSGFRRTFSRLYGIMGIDYILYSKDMIPLSYEIIDVDFSDHLPLVSEFELLTK
ncbi:MAG: endonuclease/exonuclease/phosphatase family protein [Rikenellaceae bacterium]|nr:endonuclease/exonuclease/phosphatase family protein [Rikenellaceae bacterium]